MCNGHGVKLAGWLNDTWLIYYVIAVLCWLADDNLQALLHIAATKFNPKIAGLFAVIDWMIELLLYDTSAQVAI